MIASVYQEIFNRFNEENSISEYINWENEIEDWEVLMQIWDSVRQEAQESTNVFQQVKIYNSQVQRSLNGLIKAPRTPAVYVEVDEEKPLTLGKSLTASDLIVKFHIVLVQLDSGIGTLDQNLDVFQLRNIVKRWFSKFKLKAGGPFTWSNEDESYIHGDIYHYVVTYKCHYIDFVGEKLYYPFVEGIEVYDLWNWDNNMWQMEFDEYQHVTHIATASQLNLNVEYV